MQTSLVLDRCAEIIIRESWVDFTGFFRDKNCQVWALTKSPLTKIWQNDYSLSNAVFAHRFLDQLSSLFWSMEQATGTAVIDKDENSILLVLHWHWSCHNNEMVLLPILTFYYPFFDTKSFINACCSNTCFDIRDVWAKSEIVISSEESGQTTLIFSYFCDPFKFFASFICLWLIRIRN